MSAFIKGFVRLFKSNIMEDEIEDLGYFVASLLTIAILSFITIGTLYLIIML